MQPKVTQKDSVGFSNQLLLLGLFIAYIWNDQQKQCGQKLRPKRIYTGGG